MYILDTNVISELRKARSNKANGNVVKWASSQPSSSMHISVITILELEMGILAKERKDPAQGALLRSWLENNVLPTFSERTIPIDTAIARHCAKLHIPNPHSERDSLIASTASVHSMTIVTRNVNDFKDAGVKMINPWSE